jgi:hypothetical protein
MAKGRTPLRSASTSKGKARKPVYESDDSVEDPNGNMNFASGGGGESSEDEEEVFNLGAANDESDSESGDEDEDSEDDEVCWTCVTV